MIERSRLVYVADMKMYVANPRSFRASIPFLSGGRSDDRLHVQRLGRHRYLSFSRNPRASRPVSIHLDAKAVRIGEIKSFAHQMIGHAGIYTNFRKMRDESSQ